MHRLFRMNMNGSGIQRLPKTDIRTEPETS